MSEKFNLIPLINLDKTIQLQVLKIRNQESVRKWMYSDHEISENEHLAWIDNLKDDKKNIVYAVMADELEPIGVISINDIDAKHKKANWGLYIGEKYQGLGIGVFLEIMLIDYCFDKMGLEKIYCEVIEGNTSVLKLHKKLLFQEEGFLRSHIIKNGIRIGVHFLGLLKSEWQIGRDKIGIRASNVIIPPPPLLLIKIEIYSYHAVGNNMA